MVLSCCHCFVIHHHSQLAETGFYFCGSAESPDAARCFMCAKELDGWEKNDDPACVHHARLHAHSPHDDSKEHQKHAPQCAYLNLEIEANRLKTFGSWPNDSPLATPEQACVNCVCCAMMSLNHAQFARAGLFHFPAPVATDQVKCFSCAKVLSGWEPGEDPL